MNRVLGNFSRCKYFQSTDKRLISLFQVAHCAHLTDCQPTTIESVEAFDRYVQLVERDFNSSNQGRGSTDDAMSQHFPFTSLRWYRLSYTCAFLDHNNIDQSQPAKKALEWAVGWASQILIHLSTSSSSAEEAEAAAVRGTRLEVSPDVIQVMSFAIDHYYVVISYAVFLLVNSWLRNFIDRELRSDHSGLFRLVDPQCTYLLIL